MAEREHEAYADGLLAFLHELSGDVVDGGYVVGVNGVAQAKAVGEQRGAEQQRKVAKCEDGPSPGGDVEDEQDGVNGDDFVAEVRGIVAKQTAEAGEWRPGGRRRYERIRWT